MSHTCPYCGVGLHHTSAVHRCAGPSVTVVTPELIAERTRAEKAEARVAVLLGLLREVSDCLYSPDDGSEAHKLRLRIDAALQEGEQP